MHGGRIDVLILVALLQLRCVRGLSDIVARERRSEYPSRRLIRLFGAEPMIRWTSWTSVDGVLSENAEGSALTNMSKTVQKIHL